MVSYGRVWYGRVCKGMVWYCMICSMSLSYLSTGTFFCPLPQEKEAFLTVMGADRGSRDTLGAGWWPVDGRVVAW